MVKCENDSVCEEQLRARVAWMSLMRARVETEGERWGTVRCEGVIVCEEQLRG